MKKIPFPNNDKTKSDPCYRYQRNSLLLEKSGQFYVLKNISEIAKDIKINLDQFIKFLQKKLGQPIIFDKVTNTYKTKSNSSDIEKYLEQFIVENLVCTNCSLPELNEEKICKACGTKK